MVFRVFPTTPHPPLPLGAHCKSGAFDLPELAGGNPPTMYIRVKRLREGPTSGPPTFLLQAGAGPTVEVTRHPNVSHIRADTSPDSPDVATARFAQEPNDVYLLKVFVEVPGQSWRLRVVNNDAEDREFIWVVADQEPESRQPWLDTPHSVRLSATCGTTVRTIVTVRNRGTGPLALTVGGTGTESHFTATPLVPTVVPGDDGEVMIQFVAPNTPGEIQDEYVVVSSDAGATDAAGHNNHVALCATIVRPDSDHDKPPDDEELSTLPCDVPGCGCQNFESASARCRNCGHDITSHGAI
ncbi:hypothetical protein I0C86_14260 [Plantactinospora sp. S1510]|uniref:Abnormal spindle-like microcephaly-associated protein ASH domain-containing protein n=1 Tax=Plantactinospora alkalitolerans TaxID=2789879 RepID=A0ABS0GV92_9ACTN|nr:hypothetical protein [Plantactinospora alkalitolerans]MBF9130112.1 hypothetical protein [Plantactinospora alkalitolerans]